MTQNQPYEIMYNPSNGTTTFVIHTDMLEQSKNSKEYAQWIEYTASEVQKQMKAMPAGRYSVSFTGSHVVEFQKHFKAQIKTLEEKLAEKTMPKWLQELSEENLSGRLETVGLYGFFGGIGSFAIGAVTSFADGLKTGVHTGLATFAAIPIAVGTYIATKKMQERKAKKQLKQYQEMQSVVDAALKPSVTERKE